MILTEIDYSVTGPVVSYLDQYKDSRDTHFETRKDSERDVRVGTCEGRTFLLLKRSFRKS